MKKKIVTRGRDQKIKTQICSRLINKSINIIKQKSDKIEYLKSINIEKLVLLTTLYWPIFRDLKIR